MSDLFKRRCSVQVGSLLVTDLRVAFDVQKTSDKEPNTAKVTIFNLGADSRRKVEQARGEPLIIRAGYEKTEAIIFTGDVRFASSDMSAATVVTTIESGDGERAYSKANVNKAFGKGTSTRDVISSVVEALGVNRGNLDKALANGLTKLTHKRGFTANGRASDVLDTLLRDHGLRYSIQNGQLQVLKPGEAIDEFLVKLDASSGLIGSPKINTPEDVTKTKKAQVKSYLQPQLKVGGIVEVVSDSLRSRYLIEKVNHTGDTSGAAWYTTVEVSVK